MHKICKYIDCISRICKKYAVKICSFICKICISLYIAYIAFICTPHFADELPIAKTFKLRNLRNEKPFCEFLRN